MASFDLSSPIFSPEQRNSDIITECPADELGDQDYNVDDLLHEIVPFTSSQNDDRDHGLSLGLTIWLTRRLLIHIIVFSE